MAVETFVLDWIYSKDAAMGTHLACWAEGLASHVFNLSMGRRYGAADIARAIEALFPGTTAHAAAPAPAAAPGDRRPMSIERARRQLGFEVRYPMPAALADYKEWLERAATGPS